MQTEFVALQCGLTKQNEIELEITKLKKRFEKAMLRVIIAITFVLAGVCQLRAEDYLSGSEVAAVGAGTAGISLIGSRIKRIPTDKAPVIRGHLPFEQSFQRWLGGDYELHKKSNFIDTEFGAFVTPLFSGVALSAINLGYPRDSRGKDFSEDIFLFVSGAMATKGITDITKGIFARDRPLRHVLDDDVNAEAVFTRSYLQQSFFSGHTSGAFFSAGFLNLRVRETMRRRMTNSEYRSWRWVSSGTLYGWAAFVGLSRVHAYKHHPSDVLVGALAGILVSELFFNFSKKSNSSQNGNQNLSPPILFRISLPI